MIHVSAGVTRTARLLWERDGAVAREDVAGLTERACTRLQVGLARWIGADGFRMLLQRAVERTRESYPALAALSSEAGQVEGIAAAVRAHGAAEVTKSMPALWALLIDSLGRVVGEDMAVRMVEHAWEAIPSPPSTAETKE